MFGYLPEAVKQQILCFLQKDNFRAAKEIYDDWINNNRVSTEMNEAINLQ
jgi:hypothetical protein